MCGIEASVVADSLVDLERTGKQGKPVQTMVLREGEVHGELKAATASWASMTGKFAVDVEDVCCERALATQEV